MSAPRPAGLPPAGRFALVAALCSSFGQTFFIGLFGADFRADFALSEAGLGTFHALATLASGLSMFWLGAIVHRLSIRPATGLTLPGLASGALLVGGAGGLVCLGYVVLVPLLLALGLWPRSVS